MYVSHVRVLMLVPNEQSMQILSSWLQKRHTNVNFPMKQQTLLFGKTSSAKFPVHFLAVKYQKLNVARIMFSSLHRAYPLKLGLYYFITKSKYKSLYNSNTINH